MQLGVHTMFYSAQPDALRAFLRDKLGFAATDVGDGWLIFNLPDAEMGCHPAEPQGPRASGTPYISFTCDDIGAAITELTARGVDFIDTPADVGYGTAVHFTMPGDFTVELYQPAYSRDP